MKERFAIMNAKVTMHHQSLKVLATILFKLLSDSSDLDIDRWKKGTNGSRGKATK